MAMMEMAAVTAGSFHVGVGGNLTFAATGLSE